MSGKARFCAAAVPEGMAAVEYAGLNREFPAYQGWKGDAFRRSMHEVWRANHKWLMA
jgi:hypothetical protein